MLGVVLGAVFAMEAALLAHLRRRFAIDVFEVTNKVTRIVQADLRQDFFGALVCGNKKVSCFLHAQRLPDLGGRHAQLLMEEVPQP